MLSDSTPPAQDDQGIHSSERQQSRSTYQSPVLIREDPTTETSETLSKILKGSVHAQWVKCGKPGCRCSRGHLHGPYSYRFFRDGGRLRKEYVPRGDLLDVVRATAARQVRQRQIRDSWRLVRATRAQVRRVEDSINEGRDMS